MECSTPRYIVTLLPLLLKGQLFLSHTGFQYDTLMGKSGRVHHDGELMHTMLKFTIGKYADSGVILVGK
jgi:hypothetical protein